MKNYIKSEYQIGEHYKIIIKDKYKFDIGISEVKGTSKRNAHKILRAKLKSNGIV